MVRRPTVELQAIIKSEKVFMSPPPAPPGTSLREWFAGLALGNPEIMRDIDPEGRVPEALRVADALINALMTPKQPTLESMAAPTEEEMQAWDEHIAEERQTRERQTRATVPDMKARKPSRKATLMGVAIDPNRESNPPPATKPERKVHYQNMGERVGSIPPPAPVVPHVPGMGRYTVVISEPTVRPTKKPR